MKSPVIIVGAPRSGTSMMMKILRRVLGYAGHNEGHFFTLLLDLQKVTDRHFEFINRFNEDPKILLALDPRIDIKRDLEEIFVKYIRLIYGDEPWMLKTPNPKGIESSKLIARIFPSTKFIIMKRRGIENILSQSRKFGDGSFDESYCLQWSDCMKALFETDVFNQSLMIDQLAYMKYPEETVSNLLNYLEIEDKQDLIQRSINRLKAPVQNTAPLTLEYIGLEETPWTDEEKSLFLDHCQEMMVAMGYPITSQEVSIHKPSKDFFISKFSSTLSVRNRNTEWNIIPISINKRFSLHPNAISSPSLQVEIPGNCQRYKFHFKATDPALTGPGMQISIEEILSDGTKTEKAIFSIRCLEEKFIELHLQNINPIIRISIENEVGSINNNYKALVMDIECE